MKDLSPLRRTIAVVLFVVGFVWFVLGVGFVQGSSMSNNAWAALFGVVCMIGTGVILGPAAFRRPFPKDKSDQ